MALAALKTPLVPPGIKYCSCCSLFFIAYSAGELIVLREPQRNDATKEKLNKYIFFEVISLRISYSASQGNRHDSNYTENRAPVTLHNAVLHAFSSRSVHPKGELVIVNYSRRANPVWQVVYTTVWASSWLASCSFRVLQSRGRDAMLTYAHREHWDGRVWRSKILRAHCKHTWAHIWADYTYTSYMLWQTQLNIAVGPVIDREPNSTDS